MARLNTDHATYPPADPAAGWSLGGVSAILSNPVHRVSGVRPPPPGPPRPSRAVALVTGPDAPADRGPGHLDAAQAAGAEHGNIRDDDAPNPHPATRRTYILRSRVRCKLCQRRMCGITRTHPDRGTRGDYTYYICQFDPGNPRHAAAVPGHPRTVAARQDLLLATCGTGWPPTPWPPAAPPGSPNSSRPGPPSAGPRRRPGRRA